MFCASYVYLFNLRCTGFTSPQPIVGRVYPSTLAFYPSKGRMDGSLDEAVIETNVRFAMFQHLKGAALFGVLEGGFQKVDRVYSAKETAKRPVAGTSCCLKTFHCQSMAMNHHTENGRDCYLKCLEKACIQRKSFELYRGYKLDGVPVSRFEFTDGLSLK